jgi:glutamate synthase (NADPH/NADH) small chain
MGFIPFKDSPLVTGFGLDTDEHGNIAVSEDYMSSMDGVFATGDAVMGASLVVRAIAQGRNAAEGIDAYLRK